MSNQKRLSKPSTAIVTATVSRSSSRSAAPRPQPAATTSCTPTQTPRLAPNTSTSAHSSSVPTIGISRTPLSGGYGKPPQILAPAGGPAQFWAALHAGADAVYLGLKCFSARAAAENFTIQQLSEILPVAHSAGMKVLVAFNTLLTPADLSEAATLLADMASLGVDGLIVQDLGVAHRVRSRFPWIPLHASTQMAIHSKQGVEWLVKSGFKRAVLARELSIADITAIRAEFPRERIELETFCHGSLCYSYSGLCLFGGCSEGRSGNRGECPYPCRRDFEHESGSGALLSMRDLDTRHCLESLVAAGVDVLKIEGRKKDAQFVAAAVVAYRKALDTLFGTSTLRASAPETARQTLAGNEIGLEFSFQREPTMLFLHAGPTPAARLAPPTTAPLSTTHVGVVAGTVESTAQGRMVFRTSIPLARFDGLLLRSADGAPQGEGFSLRDMRVGSKWSPTAAPGERVEMEIPLGLTPQVGDSVVKLRSALLRAQVDALARPSERLTALWPLDMSVSFSHKSNDCQIILSARSHGEPVATHTAQVAWLEEAPFAAKHIEDLFSLFGSHGFGAHTLQVTPPQESAGSPRLSDVKSAKRAFGEILIRDFSQLRAARVADLMTASAPDRNPPSTARLIAGVSRAAHMEAVLPLVDEVILRTQWAGACHALLDEWSGSCSLLRLALPPVIRDWESAEWKEVVEIFFSRGGSLLEVSHPATITLALKWGASPQTIVGGPWLYARNAWAVQWLASMNLGGAMLSPEASTEEWVQLAGVWPHPFSLRAPLHHSFPLMISESCPWRGNGKCEPSRCSSGNLRNESGQWKLRSNRCRTWIFPQKPFERLQELQQLFAAGIREFLVDTAECDGAPPQEQLRTLRAELISLTQAQTPA